MQKSFWRSANTKLVPSALVALVGAIISSWFGNIHNDSFHQTLIAVGGVLVFLAFSVIFTQILTSTVYQIIAHNRLGAARAGAIRFTLRIVCYVAIFVIILGLLDIPIGHLLIGGAAIGIILGVAAQQALANFFASIVLIISHPYSVGQKITIISGPLGGTYEGTVIDIGLTHTRIKEKNGELVSLPNATLLSGASIRIRTASAHEESENL